MLQTMDKKKPESIHPHLTNAEFLSHVSHEICSPLNIIIGFTEAMLLGIDGPLNESQQESLQTISRAANNLLGFTNDFIDFLQVTKGTSLLLKEPCDILAVIQTCIKGAQKAANEKNLSLVVETKLDECIINADPKKIKCIIANLLSNAIKFSPEGKITVHLETKDLHVYIRVEDQGIGIEQSELPNVFTPFSQVHNIQQKQHNGIGVGLALAKSYAIMHHGEIRVASQKNNGSTFTVELPIS